MLTRNDHDDFVGRLYASAMGDIPWASTLDRAGSLFRSSAAILQVNGPDGMPLSVEYHGYSPEFAASYYSSEIYANDPRLPVFRRVPAGSVYYDHAVLDVDAAYRDPRVRAACDAVGSKYSLGAVTRLTEDSTAAFCLFSTEDEGHADEAAIQALRRLAPHLEQACSLGRVVEHRAASQAALIEGLASRAEGVILLGGSGRPSFLNDAAAAILAAADGLGLGAGVLAAARGPENRRLQRLVGDAIAAAAGADRPPGGRMLVTRPSGRLPYVVRVMQAPPVERFLAARAIACVIQIRDLAAERVPDKGSLRAVFGLSEREADLAVELVRSAGLAQAAASAGMAVNTARNHLQSIFRKAGITSQAEAVLLFSRLA